MKGQRIPPGHGQHGCGRSGDCGLGGIHLHPTLASQVWLQ